MKYRPQELKSLFKKFKNGDSDAFEAIVGSEKERLFDYLMRMTGQVSKSLDVMQEAVSGLTSVADQEDDLEEFLVLFYRTARSFAMDVWNADTSKLENAAYSAPDQDISEKISVQLQELERVVRSLPATQREVILLHLRYGFSVDDVSDITSYDENEVKEYLDHAQSVLKSALGKSKEKLEESFIQLKNFPMPEDALDGTQNLSIVVRDLKKSSKSTPGGVLRLLSGMLLLALLAYLILNHQMIFEYLEAISAP